MSSNGLIRASKYELRRPSPGRCYRVQEIVVCRFTEKCLAENLCPLL